MKYLKGIFKIFFRVWNLKISIILGGFFPLIWFLNYSTTASNDNSFRFYSNMNEAGIYQFFGRFYQIFLDFFLGLEWGQATAFLGTILTVGSLPSFIITALLFARCFFSKKGFNNELEFVFSHFKSKE